MEKLDICSKVEQKVGHQMQSAQDFAWLSDHIWETVHQKISVNTLKRLWGYLLDEQQVRPMRHTLDVLARYVGYKDYSTLQSAVVAQKSDGNPSDRVRVNHLETKLYGKGLKVELTWKPDRRMLIEKIDDRGVAFRILEAEKTKLSVDDTFDCPLIIENEALYLNNLVHQGAPPISYIAGKLGGIHFQVFEE
ncbi:MAG: hypothetical protein IKH01_15610 [Prevotella sp.]|nr:hypothetical protein [Prevotella sp.]